MSTDGLSEPVTLWMRWKRATELIRASTIADVAAETPLTEPELTVLVHLSHAGGTLRQNALVDATGWDRTRLSHLLSRMERQDYVTRERLRNGVDVILNDAGRRILADARPPLDAAVRRHLTSKLTAEQLASFGEILAALER